MHRRLAAQTAFRLFGLFLGFSLLASPLLLRASSGKRVHLAPRFVPGATLRYNIESRAATTGTTTTPIVNPEGGTRSSVTIHLLVRLDVLSPPTSGAARLRATFEKSSAESQSDAFDPAQPPISDQYAGLQGQYLEFTIAPGGHFTDIKGLDDAPAIRAARQSSLSWLAGVSFAAGFPADGIEIGQKWKSERPVEGAPLAGLAWHVEYTYLRDEPCSPPPGVGAAPRPSASPDSCAVILSRFEISRAGSPHSDATPEDYLRNGLRVSGSWTGSGENLSYVSLASGLLVRSTETSDQQMDYKITSAASGSNVHRQAQVHAQSEIMFDSATSVSPTK